MKKNTILFFMIMMVVLFGCSSQSQEQTKQIKITVRSASGVTNHLLNADTKKIVSSSALDYQSGLTTNREYTYNLDGKLASVIVDSQAEGNYVISYADVNGHQGRSARSEDVSADSVSVRRITKTTQNGRGENSTSDTFVEYYHNEDGSISLISKIDENNNIFVKGETK